MQSITQSNGYRNAELPASDQLDIRIERDTSQTPAEFTKEEIKILARFEHLR